MFIRNRLAIAVMAATSAIAQAENSVNVQPTLMNQVTVTATRTEKAVKDVAGSVSVIDERHIEKQMATSVEDLLRYEPGLTTQGNSRQGMQSYNIRGMSGNRVKVLIDGVKMPSTFQSGSNYLRPEQDFVDIDSLKAVEIVKGPGSTLYGTDAMGGVVAFVTKSPADYLKGEGDDSHASIKAGFSGANTGFSETLTFANRSGQLETLLQYTRRDYNETDTHSGADIQGAARGKEESLDSGLNNILAEARYLINENHQAGIKVDWLDQSSSSGLEANADPRDYSNDSRVRQRLTFYHDWDSGNALFDQAKTQFSWQNAKSNQVTYVHGLHYGNRKKDYFYEQGGYHFGTQFNKLLNQGNTDHHLTYGLSWSREDLENNNHSYRLDTGELLPPDAAHEPGRYAPLARSQTYGLFLQDEITLADGQFTLTPGIRYDSYTLSPETDPRYTTQLDDNSGDAFTAKLGALYRVTDSVNLFAVYSQGFRAPTLDEAYYSYVNDLGFTQYGYIANPDLKPEESDSFEVGLRGEGFAGAWEAVAFYNDYKNFIEEITIDDPDLPAGAFMKDNIAKATVKGLELKGELWLDEAIDAPAGLTLSGAIAYAKGTDLDADKPLQSIAPLSGVFGLNYDHPSERYGGAFILTAVARKDQKDIQDDNRFETPGYGVLDVTAYYSPIKDLTIRGGLFNITDKHHWSWEDVRLLSKTGRGPLPESGLDRYAQPGRHVSVSAKYVF